ncbi:MAG TPA: WbqC family protein [Verrucomicrobiae bacterium]|nr:WbqC family protein [Verrucomicrobiae bacterium]
MIVSISQPTVFPWIGYFNIIKSSDIFVFLDNVKFEKHSWQMRNRIKQISGNDESYLWIRIPTRVEKSETMIRDVLIDNSQNWRESHVKTFRINYGKGYDDISFLHELYENEWQKLVDFNIKAITKCCEYLEIKTKLVMASDLNCEGKKGELVFNICKKLETTEYLTSVGAVDYLEDYRNMFETGKVGITYHDYKHPVYRQKGKKFLEGMSILDLIFNEKENSKNFV